LLFGKGLGYGARIVAWPSTLMGDSITPQQRLTITLFQRGEATTRPKRFPHITNGPLHPAFLIAGA